MNSAGKSLFANVVLFESRDIFCNNSEVMWLEFTLPLHLKVPLFNTCCGISQSKSIASSLSMSLTIRWVKIFFVAPWADMLIFSLFVSKVDASGKKCFKSEMVSRAVASSFSNCLLCNVLSSVSVIFSEELLRLRARFFNSMLSGDICSNA